VRIGAAYGSGIANGTGFLIAPDVVLSNHHVLVAEGRPSEAVVWLDYENTPAGTERPHTEIQGLVDSVVGEQEADWAILKLERPVSSAYEPLSLFPSAPAKAGDRCYIVQHPGGGPKQLGLHKNLVRFADDSVVQYFTDTMAGSSGSPVFNQRWEVVALHHRYIRVPMPNKREEIRNQGIAIGRIVAGMKQMGCLPEGQRGAAAA
jgi:V8-like Glu-specific endopeptidase